VDVAIDDAREDECAIEIDPLLAARRRGTAGRQHFFETAAFNHEFGSNDRTLFDWLYISQYKSGAWPAKDTETVNRASISLGVRAHWSLDRLIFNAEVLDVSSLVGVQEGLLREITSLYFTRRRLMTAMVLNPPQSPNEKITEELRLAEITANLDALTGGYFTKETDKRLAGD